MNQTIDQKSPATVKMSSTPTACCGPHHHAPLGLQTVAIFEAVKGILVLVAGLGLLSLVHRDAQVVAEQIVRALHLNPARHFPNIFIDFASNLTDGRLWSLALGALAYSTVRLVEAYGLWHERSWAEWFAVLSSGIFLPLELSSLINKHTLIHFAIFVINVGIVVYLAYLLACNARRKCKTPAP